MELRAGHHLAQFERALAGIRRDQQRLAQLIECGQVAGGDARGLQIFERAQTADFVGKEKTGARGQRLMSWRIGVRRERKFKTADLNMVARAEQLLLNRTTVNQRGTAAAQIVNLPAAR